MSSALPLPVPPKRFGCATCRHAIAAEGTEPQAVPDLFIPVERSLGREMLPWTRPFHSCRDCEAIWLLWPDAADQRLRQHATPRGMARALLPEALLNDLLVPLFAWAPVDVATDQALREITYEPQQLWNRLIDAWRDPDISVARQATILRQLARLLEPDANDIGGPRHHSRWRLQRTHGFEKDLKAAAARLKRDERVWAPYAAAARKNLHTLQRLLSSPGIVYSRPYGFGKTAPREPPSAITRVAPVPAAESLSHRPPEEAPAAATLPARTAALLWPYASFLPAFLCGLLLVDAVGRSPEQAGNLVAGAFFFAVVLVLNGSAVARNARISAAPLWQIIWHRMSVIGDYLLFSLMAMILLVLIAAAGLAESPRSAILAFALGLVVLLLRFWPFWIIPYLQPVERDLSSPHVPGVPKRSALRTAWQLTGEGGVLHRYTLPWLGVSAGGVALVAISHWLLGDTGRSLVLYALILPSWTAFTWALVERMPDAHPEPD